MKMLWSKKIIIPAIVIATFYVIVVNYLMNSGLVIDALFGAHSLAYKWNLLIALLAGMWTAMSRLSLILLIIIGLLTGVNLVLVVKRINFLRASGKLRFMVGGSSLLGIVGSGCITCGLPILALLGFGGAIFYLPFRGIELSALAILMLAVSFYFLVKDRPRQKICATS